jgi:hypothetical protein
MVTLGVKVQVGGGLLIVRVYGLVPEQVPDVALTVKLDVTAAVGVPLKVPPEERVSPAGNVPLETSHV